MSEPAVSALGYVVLGVRDRSAWRNYAERILGLACVADGEALLARMDAASWRIRIVESGEDDLQVAGFELPNRGALAVVKARLQHQGVEVEDGDARQCQARCVDALACCSDPDGLDVELYVGHRRSDVPFESPAGVREFVTGDQGLGHMVISVSDLQRAEAFYRDGLGFRLSDYVTMGKPGSQITLTFLHCNPRHHTLALIPLALAKRLNHIMLQVSDMDDVGRAFDAATDAGTAITSSMGRHTNDRMFSFYMRTPSGFDIEYGHGGIEVDDASWEVRTYDAPSLWGHRRQA